jgi:hypothetical protein
MRTYEFKKFDKPNLISIMGVLEKYGWNVYVHNGNECFILKDTPKDFSELVTKDYVCLKLLSDSMIKLGVHLRDKKVNFIDDFCSKKILVTDDDIRILANEREIVFRNFSNVEYDSVKDSTYQRRTI